MLCSSCGFMINEPGRPCPRCGTTTPGAAGGPGAVGVANGVRGFAGPGAAGNFRARSGLVGGGMLALGTLLVGIAGVLHAHFAPINALCSTWVGQLGQAFSASVANECGLASTAESAVGPLTFIGVMLLLLGIGALALLLTRARRV